MSFSRYSHTDPDFEEILKSIKVMFDRPYNLSPLNSMPWLRHFGFLHNLVIVFCRFWIL